VVGEIPLHAFICLLGYALSVAEEVAGGSTVVNLVELVNIVGELINRVLFLDSLAVSIVPVFFDENPKA
jgi:hypothetical protein